MGDKHYDDGPPNSKIFIGNLDRSATEGDVRNIFEQYGPVGEISMRKGFAFVQFSCEEHAQNAISGEQSRDINGRNIGLSLAKIRNHTTQENFQEDNSYFKQNKRLRPDNNSRGRGAPLPPRGFRGGRGRGRGRGWHFEEEPDNTNFYSGGSRGRGSRGGRGGGRGDEDYDNYGEGFYGQGSDTSYDYGDSSYYDGPPSNQNYSNQPPPLEGPSSSLDQSFGPTNASMVSNDKKNDVEIVCANRSTTRYAESIEARLRNMSLEVDVLYPNPDIPLPKILGNITSRGVLYAILITPMSMEHRSVTVNVLQGTQQEHRNMPVDDALNFISRNFEKDLKKKSSSEPPLPENHPQDILNVLEFFHQNRPLSVMEYDKLIRYLSRRREEMLRSEYGDSIPSHLLTPPIGPPIDPVLKVKQEEYHAKILKILKSKKDIFSRINDSAVGVPPPPSSINPSLQKAIDSLIKTGPNLLSQIGAQKHQKDHVEGKGNNVLSNYFSTLLREGNNSQSSSGNNMFSAYSGN